MTYRVERRDGPTPAGGTYSEAILADDGTILEITEYDAAGKAIMRHYGVRSPDTEPDPDEP